MNIQDLMIKPNFISKQNKVDELIREMQDLKIHLAIVSDEYGGTSGIVTMEDALEELVGEIYDETDEYDETEDPEKIISVGDNKYRVSAEMELNYLFDELNIDNYPDTKYSSIGGFVYKLCEDISSEGQKIEYLTSSLDGRIHYKLIFTIEKMTTRRIKLLTIEVIIIDEEQEGTE
jgi:CBS domain containing-hemolysin-like protein